MRPDSKSEELTQALKRLEKIETTLDCIAQKVGVQDQPRYQAQSEPSPFVSTPLAFRHESVTPSPASLSTSCKSIKQRYACKMPNLLTFKHPLPEYSDWSWNCTEFFFTDQMDAIADMRQHVNLPLPDPDLSDPHTRNLERSFADNVLKWLPLLDPNTAAHHLQYARQTQYRHTNSSLCVVFLIFANGAISADSSLYAKSGHELPGFAYYARAISLLDRMPASSKDLTALQCRVLVAIYLLFAMRPLEAWKHITAASQECILLLRANTNNDTTIGPHLNEFREAFRRIYWICYVLENELEACLEVPTSGIRSYESQVPMPTSRFEEEGMYFLLAISSLRKVMVEVLDTVGYKSTSGSVTYNPAVALELRTQIDQWYHHLPGPLRFPLDRNMLFDTRKAYLRCCYYALMAVATWPFVIPLSSAPFSTPAPGHRPSFDQGHPPDGPRSHTSQDTAPTADNPHQSNGTPKPSSAHPEPESLNESVYQQAAQICLSACQSYLTYAEEILTSKLLVSHLIVRQYYAFTMILVICFPGVDLQDGTSMEQRRTLEGTMRNLQYWDVVPFMAQSLNAMSRIGRARGLGRGH